MQAPPIYGWSGSYTSWEEAKGASKGYSTDIILEKCKNALLKVKNREAVYERDGVLFEKIQYSWPVLAGLLKVALENGNKLSVLDFGGSLGTSYYQNRTFTSFKELNWCIVEQENFVECGKKHFQNNELMFFKSVQDCLEDIEINVVLISGVLQYLKEPYSMIDFLCSKQIKNIIVDCMPFNNIEIDRLTVQNVPPSIYEASYPCWLLNYNKVIEAFSKTYKVVSEHNNELSISVDGRQVSYKGFILELNENKGI